MVNVVREIVLEISKGTIEAHKAAEAGAFKTAYNLQAIASNSSAKKLYALYKQLQREAEKDG